MQCKISVFTTWALDSTRRLRMQMRWSPPHSYADGPMIGVIQLKKEGFRSMRWFLSYNLFALVRGWDKTRSSDGSPIHLPRVDPRLPSFPPGNLLSAYQRGMVGSGLFCVFYWLCLLILMWLGSGVAAAQARELPRFPFRCISRVTLILREVGFQGSCDWLWDFWSLAILTPKTPFNYLFHWVW